jgi:hypothetical protein
MDSNLSKVSNDFKEYTIAEVATCIGVSKATVYNKIHDFQNILESHVKVRKGIKYLDETGLHVIKDSIGVSKNRNAILETLESVDKKQHETKDLSPLETLERYVKSLENQIEFLKKDKDTQIVTLNEQLKVKDTQIQSLADALSKSQKLNENNQILLSQAQQKILYLEESGNKSYWWQFWKKKH